jgi:hypothetical protein
LALPPEQRGAIELAMKGQLLAVHYDCGQLQILDDCRLEGSYAYVATTAREQVMTFVGEAELKANFSIGGEALNKSVPAGSQLDVALAIVGQKVSVKRDARRSELKGQCAGATHFVRSASIGAFSMSVVPSGVPRSVDQVFGLTGGSTARFSQRDGSIEACRKGAPSDAVETPGCAAPLRLELRPVTDAAAKTSDLAEREDESSTITCPQGSRADDHGKCVAPSAQPYVCDFHEPADCEKQCQAGSPGSCSVLARSYETGRGVTKDATHALKLYVDACNAGSPPACGHLGNLLVGSERTRQKGLELLDRACKAGWMPACSSAAQALLSSKTSAAEAYSAARRGCNGGSAQSCGVLGLLFQEGLGVAKNPSESLRYYKIACDGGTALGCPTYADALDPGHSETPETPHALKILTEACDRGNAASCSQLSLYYFLGKGVPVDNGKGLALLERACTGADFGACLVAGMRYEHGTGAPRDPAKAAALLNRACEAALVPACEEAARLRKQQEKTGNAP